MYNEKGNYGVRGVARPNSTKSFISERVSIEYLSTSHLHEDEKHMLVWVRLVGHVAMYVVLCLSVGFFLVFFHPTWYL